MSQQKRAALRDQIVEGQPSIRDFIESSKGNPQVWDFTAYSFELGFEAMWDLARADHRGLLNLPLLSLWRQSIELSLKSAIVGIGGTLDKKSGHELPELFKQLVQLSSEQGLCNNDDITRSVQEMVEFTQKFDPHADRFRYPSKRDGTPYEDVNVDLDKLFQAHDIIVGYCFGTCVELGY
jgi:HEPN domain-containing protein